MTTDTMAWRARAACATADPRLFTPRHGQGDAAVAWLERDYDHPHAFYDPDRDSERDHGVATFDTDHAFDCRCREDDQPFSKALAAWPVPFVKDEL